MSRIVAGLVVSGIVVASSLFIAVPAQADPGETSAIGAYAQFVFDSEPIVIDEQNTVGFVAVDAPGVDSFADSDITLVDALIASVTIDEVATVAENTGTETTSDAAALGTNFNFLGFSVVGFDTAAAAVSCPASGSATAEAELEGLTIFGVPVELDENLAATDSIALPADAMIDGDEVDLSDYTLHVRVGQIAYTSADFAYATAFSASFAIENEEAQLHLSSFGSLVLASAGCESPTVVPVPAPAQLAATGSDAAPVMFLGLGILAAGVVLLVARRRAVS